jgi:hypothetical protein
MPQIILSLPQRGCGYSPALPASGGLRWVGGEKRVLPRKGLRPPWPRARRNPVGVEKSRLCTVTQGRPRKAGNPGLGDEAPLGQSDATGRIFTNSATRGYMPIYFPEIFSIVGSGSHM